MGYERKQAPLFLLVYFMTMHEHEMRQIVSILMESPFYMTLSLKERKSLLERLAEDYPDIAIEPDEQDGAQD